MSLKNMASYIGNVERRVSSLIESAKTARKEYIQLISMFESAMSQLKKFIEVASCIESSLAEEKTITIRLCGKWLKYESNGSTIMARLEPRMVISFDGSEVKLAFKDYTVAISGLRIRMTINQLNADINLENVDEVLSNYGVISLALSELTSEIVRRMNDFVYCIKERRLRCEV